MFIWDYAGDAGESAEAYAVRHMPCAVLLPEPRPESP